MYAIVPLNITCNYGRWGIAITKAKGHEPIMYEALLVIVGLFFNFTFVRMKGPNKTLNH